MEQTLTEKILSQAIGQRVHVGDTVVVPVQRMLLHDGTAPRVLDRLKALGAEHLVAAERTTLFVDHGAPPPTPKIAVRQSRTLTAAREHGIQISPGGEGISHQVMVESHACPGEVIVGADSHTCMAGALGAFAVGMGSTDVACAIALGETWLPVPSSILVELVGDAFAAGVTAKDLMLTLCGRLGASGANGSTLEFGGPALGRFDIESRYVLSNLAAEVGATTGLIPSDLVTRDALADYGRGESFAAITADSDAKYLRRLKLHLGKQVPMVALPGRHDDVAAVESLAPESIDQVVIGSCTNGRLSDFIAAADILTDKKVHPRVNLVLVPASHKVLQAGMEAGVIQALVAAGGTLATPGCGPCVGIHQGVLGKNQVCVATQSRNFPGRMGHLTSKIYLSSPYTAAAAALTGELIDPREVLDGA